MGFALFGKDGNNVPEWALAVHKAVGIVFLITFCSKKIYMIYSGFALKKLSRSIDF